MMFQVMNAFTHQIQIWNEKLNGLAAKYTDSPWAGMLLFILLFAFGCWAISALTKK